MEPTTQPEEVLEQLGLSEGERKVYLSLLKIGVSPVAQIKEDTGLHRTTIYDFLESLQQKGLVSASKEGRSQHFKATHPQRLLDFVNQKRDQVELIIPMLEQLSQTEFEDIDVEVLRGLEGFKAVVGEALRHDTGIIAFGVDEEKFMKTFPPHVMDGYFAQIEKLGRKDRVLTKESATHFYDEKHTEYRLIPDEYFNPTTTFISGDYVCIMTWEPLTNILIRNRELADAYRKQFEYTWKHAKVRNTRDSVL